MPEHPPIPVPKSEDERHMRLALEEAQAAFDEDEVPIGAVILGPGPEHAVLGRAHNRTRREQDPTGHAELLAIRAAAKRVGFQRLPGSTLFTTVEPCFMCAGAILHARLARVVYGALDPKFGGTVSLGRVLDVEGTNHCVEHEGGVCAEEARRLLQSFFRAKRPK